MPFARVKGGYRFFGGRGVTCVIVPDRIMMIRPRLDGLQSFELPEPYTIRWHRDGDDRYWMSMKSASDTEHQAPPDFYERTYGEHRDALPQRQAFLCDGTGEPVGTVTAWWFENLRDFSLGKLNWMLIVPRAQGFGLSKPLRPQRRMKRHHYSRRIPHDCAVPSPRAKACPCRRLPSG